MALEGMQLNGCLSNNRSACHDPFLPLCVATSSHLALTSPYLLLSTLFLSVSSTQAPLTHNRPQQGWLNLHRDPLLETLKTTVFKNAALTASVCGSQSSDRTGGNCSRARALVSPRRPDFSD